MGVCLTNLITSRIVALVIRLYGMYSLEFLKKNPQRLLVLLSTDLKYGLKRKTPVHFQVV